MSRFAVILSVLTLIAPTTVVLGEPLFDMRTWRNLPERSISRLARAVMKDAPDPWIHAVSPDFIYHASSIRTLEVTAGEADWHYQQLAEWIPIERDLKRAHVFLVEHADSWRRVMARTGRREEGIAMQVGREIYILRDGRIRAAYTDLPHELVHFRLGQAYPHQIPLWLEEGLAEHLGWVLAQQFHREVRDLLLYRQQEPIAAEDVLDWSEFFALKKYPDDPAVNRVFYRQSGALIAGVLERMSVDEALRVLLGDVEAARSDGAKFMQTLLALDADAWSSFLSRVEEQVRHPAGAR